MILRPRTIENVQEHTVRFAATTAPSLHFWTLVFSTCPVVLAAAPVTPASEFAIPQSPLPSGPPPLLPPSLSPSPSFFTRRRFCLHFRRVPALHHVHVRHSPCSPRPCVPPPAAMASMAIFHSIYKHRLQRLTSEIASFLQWSSRVLTSIAAGTTSLQQQSDRG